MKKYFVLFLCFILLCVSCGKKEPVNTNVNDVQVNSKIEQETEQESNEIVMEEQTNIETEEVIIVNDEQEISEYELTDEDKDILVKQYISNMKYCYDDGNMLISPYSIINAMTMASLGMDGNTLQEFINVYDLGPIRLANIMYALNKELTSKQQFKNANSIWTEIQLREDYVSNLKKFLSAEYYDGIDIDKVNKWVSSNTDDLIQKILDETSPDLVTLLINACVFDADWKIQYEDEYLTYRPFINIDGQEEDMKWMKFEEYPSNYVETDDVIGCFKDYENDEFSFLVLLPKDENIGNYVKNFSLEEYKKILESKGNNTKDVNLYLPTFEYDYSIELQDMFKEQGLTSAFDAETANFTNMSDLSIYISKILHKTYIKVDNKGTKAAAVTAIMMEKCALFIEDETPIDVEVDRPFMYMIIDNETELPIFMGVCTSLDN